MAVLNLSEIKIPRSFSSKPPRAEKVERATKELQENRVDGIIVHPDTRVLVDGYSKYLAAKKLGFESIAVRFGKKARPKKRIQKPRVRKVLSPLEKAVWEAEDGRCEACKRPMDRSCTTLLKRAGEESETADGFHLVCIDCYKKQPDMLAAPIVVSKKASQTLQENDLEGDWVIDILREYGVLLSKGQQQRKYWVPGIGTFEVGCKGGERIIQDVPKVYKDGELKVSKQKRTRGLPQPVLTLA